MAKAAHSRLSYSKNKNRLRPVIAVALVVLVGAGGAWLMFQESGDGLAADESIPWSTMTDDRYVSDEPVDYTPKPVRTPTGSPSTPGRTPSGSPTRTPTPGETPTPGDPTDEPTTVPTSSSTTVPTTDPRPTTDPTTTSRPTQSTSPRPTKPPASTPPPTETTPPWTDPGNMDDYEMALFHRINSGRADRGCDPVLPHTGLSGTSAARAGQMAEERQYEHSSGRQAVAGGDGTVSVSEAYSQMTSSYGHVLFDCGLETLGVGRQQANPCTAELLGTVCLARTRTTGWAATFGYR